MPTTTTPEQKSMGVEQISDVLGVVGKVIAAAAVVLYGVLFLAYRNYYSAVNVDPEDVGIDNSYILARSPGFILITLGVGIVVIGLVSVGSSYSTGRFTITDGLRMGITAILSFALAHYFYSLFPRELVSPWLLWAIFLALVMIGPVAGAITERYLPNYKRVALALAGAMISIALTSVAVFEQAEVRGSLVKAGQPVESFDIFSIPIVDVSASRVRLSWTGSGTPALAVFNPGTPSVPTSGVLIGQNSDSVIASVRIASRIHVVRLNAAQVTVTFEEES